MAYDPNEADRIKALSDDALVAKIEEVLGSLHMRLLAEAARRAEAGSLPARKALEDVLQQAVTKRRKEIAESN